MHSFDKFVGQHPSLRRLAFVIAFPLAAVQFLMEIPPVSASDVIFEMEKAEINAAMQDSEM
jgi:hypothetical protein